VDKKRQVSVARQQLCALSDWQGAVMVLHKQVAPEQARTDVVQMQLDGAVPDAEPVGLDQLPGTSSYLLGNDPAQWHTDIPAYSRVSYDGIYPGVDLVYYGNQRQLEYDFIVEPHADPNIIHLHFSGTKGLKLDTVGNLQILAEDGQDNFQKAGDLSTC
jgi:hypothetical protein